MEKERSAHFEKTIGSGGMIRLRKTDWKAMHTHVIQVIPEEAVGFVAGFRGRSTAVFPVENILHNPDRFKMNPRQQVEALLKIESRNWDLLAIYHSHPNQTPYPTQLDVAGHYPSAAMIIWTQIQKTWTFIAYLLKDGKAVEIPVKLLLK